MITRDGPSTYYVPTILSFNSARDTSVSVPRKMLYAACIGVAVLYHLYLPSTVLIIFFVTFWSQASGGGVQPSTFDLHLLRDHCLHVDIVLHANAC